MQVTVQVIGVFPTQLSMDVKLEQTIHEFKQQIQDMHGFPYDGQRLIFAGQALDNDRTIGDYSIKHGSTLHLVSRMRISVKTPMGKTMMLGGVLPTDTIGKIKNRIYFETKCELLPQHQRLTWARFPEAAIEELQDAGTLNEHNIGQDSCIELEKFIVGEGGQSAHIASECKCEGGSCPVCKFWSDWEVGV